MVKKSERERASVHVMLYALLVFAFAMDRFRRPSWYSKGIRTDVFCVNKEKKRKRELAGQKRERGLRLRPKGVVFFIYFICVLHSLYVSAILFSAFIVFAFLIYFVYLPFCFLNLLCLFSSILFSCCPYLSMYVYIHIHSLCI